MWVPGEALVGAMEWIRESQGRKAIGELDGRFLMGKRRLEQLFRQEVGISPKAYARIVRMRSVCHSMVRSPHRPLVQHALDHGFFDQSHFNREFKHFLGMTPRQCRLALQEKRSVYELSL